MGVKKSSLIFFSTFVFNLPNRCHFGPCPTCKQVCDRKMSCGHSCPAPCHDKVKVTVNANGPKASVPWEERGPRSEVKTLDCPDCQHPVPVTCLGGHETADWPCHAAKAGSCGRKCGRRLPCGNHTCQRDCHRVRHAPAAEEAGVNCRKCEVGCQRERPDGCSHPCPRACHPGECEQCKQVEKECFIVAKKYSSLITISFLPASF